MQDKCEIFQGGGAPWPARYSVHCWVNDGPVVTFAITLRGAKRRGARIMRQRRKLVATL